MVLLPINGHVVLVDEGDLALVRQHQWTVFDIGSTSYAATEISRHRVYMHRLITGAGEDDVVDHINRNGLDNRRKNLRLVTQKENIANAGMFSNNTTGYRGVIRYRKGYRAQTKYRHNGKQYIVTSRTFSDLYFVAMVRDEMMRLIHGPTVFVNLPDREISEEARQEAERVVARLHKRLNGNGC